MPDPYRLEAPAPTPVLLPGGRVRAQLWTLLALSACVTALVVAHLRTR